MPLDLSVIAQSGSTLTLGLSETILRLVNR
jgi:hypothetical protein